MTSKAFIIGCEGHQLSDEEVAFIKDQRPWGFIIFARNIDTPDQVRSLCAQFRECVGREDAPILIDEEGGRVQRLRPPHWNSYPAGKILGDIYQKDNAAGLRAAWVHARLIARDLHDIGVNVDCLPVLDVPVEGAHDAIGNRAYSFDPDIVAEIGRQVVEGLKDGGVLPVIKHMPGHGRAMSDSHFDLPRVDEDLETLLASDFKPFTALNQVAMAMTAHIVFNAIDPDLPSTTSKRMIDEIIRGSMGFDGLLMSDDVSMSALSGDYRQRSEQIFAAGCDIVLHCNGLMDEMQQVSAVTPQLSGESLKRANRALGELKPAQDADISALQSEFEALAKIVG